MLRTVRFATLNRPALPAAGVRATQRPGAAIDLADRFHAYAQVRRAVLFLAVRAARGATLQS
ncbi:Glycosyl hydrolase [Cupriavidus necator]|nr:glycosyl hydrolase [Cupriavidus necator]QCC04815.1 glycosyl hydrolase [Cupriavidus necator H16]QQB79507.1 glycosyl hydrolase [Cupriavidus necator]WKA43740.1 glycosyl hydrolase [Cupriavidus necator]